MPRSVKWGLIGGIALLCAGAAYLMSTRGAAARPWHRTCRMLLTAWRGGGGGGGVGVVELGEGMAEIA